MRRMFAMLLALCLLLSAVPAGVWAAGENETEVQWLSPESTAMPEDVPSAPSAEEDEAGIEWLTPEGVAEPEEEAPASLTETENEDESPVPPPPPRRSRKLPRPSLWTRAPSP